MSNDFGRDFGRIWFNLSNNTYHRDMARESSSEGRAIGRRIRERRGRMTIGMLATYSGVSKSYLSQLENGQVPDPSVRKIQAIARALGCTLQDLIGPDHAGETQTIAIPRDDMAAFRARLAAAPKKAVAQLNRVAEDLGLYVYDIAVRELPEAAAEPEPADCPDQRRDGKQPREPPAARTGDDREARPAPGT